jgi:hypothetical protein
VFGIRCLLIERVVSAGTVDGITDLVSSKPLHRYQILQWTSTKAIFHSAATAAVQSTRHLTWYHDSDRYPHTSLVSHLPSQRCQDLIGQPSNSSSTSSYEQCWCTADNLKNWDKCTDCLIKDMDRAADAGYDITASVNSFKETRDDGRGCTLSSLPFSNSRLVTTD